MTITLNKPGELLSAKVDGVDAIIYVSLSSLDTDGKARYRYAPGHKLAHELIDKKSSVEVIGPVVSQMDMTKYRKS